MRTTHSLGEAAAVCSAHKLQIPNDKLHTIETSESKRIPLPVIIQFNLSLKMETLKFRNEAGRS
jgi:hypothetical protein